MNETPNDNGRLRVAPGEKLRRFLPAAGISALFLLALWLLYRQVTGLRPEDISVYFRQLPPVRMGLSFLSVAATYLSLTGYDFLALRYIRHPLRYRNTAFASFTGFALSNNTGYAPLTGGIVRYRLYSLWGLSALQSAQVVFFITLTSVLGFITVVSVVFLVGAGSIPASLSSLIPGIRFIGALFPAVLVGYLCVTVLVKKPLKIRKLRFHLPSLPLTAMQIACSSAVWFFSWTAFYLLLPSLKNISYAGFIQIYVLSQFAGTASQVPGGLGVYELLILHLLRSNVGLEQIVGALLAYRALYYFLPLAAAAVLLVGHWASTVKIGAGRGRLKSIRWTDTVAPRILGLLTFAGGAVMLGSAAVAGSIGGNGFITSPLTPPGWIRVVYVLITASSIWLVFLARGIQAKSAAARRWVLCLAGAALLFCALKGIGYVESGALLLVVGVLLPAGNHFDRRSAFRNVSYSAGWKASIALVICTGFMLTLIFHPHRALPAVIIPLGTGTGLAFVIFFLMRSSGRKAGVPGAAPMRLSSSPPSIVRRVFSRGQAGGLVLPSRDAFVAYGVASRVAIVFGIQDRSWISFSNPLGPRTEWVEALRMFGEMCERYSAEPVFYGIDATAAPYFIDSGMAVQRIGEEGLIRLRSSLAGGTNRSGFRGKRALFTLDVLPAASRPGTPAGRAALNRISGAAAAPSFEPHPMIAVLKKEGAPVASADIILNRRSRFLAVEAIRLTSGEPEDALEQFFLHLLTWGESRGMRICSIGIVPDQELITGSLSDMLKRIGTSIFRHGELFGTLAELRNWKERLQPLWKPRYIASTTGFALPKVLADIAKLFSRPG